MPAVSRARARSLPRRVEAWAHVAGLGATAWLVLPHDGPHLFQRFLQGWVVASLALGWAVLMVYFLRRVIRHVSGLRVVPMTFRSGSAGVWYAPAILLPLNPVGVTAAVVLVIGATRLLCSEAEGADWSSSTDRQVLQSGELALNALPRHLGSALAVSAGLQGAVCLMLLNHPVSASGVFAVSIATLTSIAIALGAWTESRPPNLPRSAMGLFLTFLLAMMAGRFLGGPGAGFGMGSGTAAVFGRTPLAQPEPDVVGTIAPSKPKAPELPPMPPPGATGEVTPDLHASEVNVPGSFPGVILWPDVKPEVTLVQPFPKGHGVGPPALLRPFVIPFGGEYWMFRWPFARPPKYSFFRRGSPAKFAFSTTDRTALQMEALQKLDRTIALSCCTAIEVTVENSDHAALGTQLELVVTDNDAPYKPPLSLGLKPLTAVGQTGAPMIEVLTYSVPLAPRLQQFDEIKVVFHRDPAHQDHSSRVAIERFTLIP